MEKKKLKKLVLKKQTVSSLDDNSLSKLKGGTELTYNCGDWFRPTHAYCPPVTVNCDPYASQIWNENATCYSQDMEICRYSWNCYYGN